jgi:hypothetical protein
MGVGKRGPFEKIHTHEVKDFRKVALASWKTANQV